MSWPTGIKLRQWWRDRGSDRAMTDRRVITEALKAAIDKMPGALTRQHAGAYILRDEVHTAIAALIEHAVADEREQCAHVAEWFGRPGGGFPKHKSIATAIRERGPA
mgnify:CR=1 FL=1